VAQGIGLEFKLQYENNNNKIIILLLPEIWTVEYLFLAL
jgi:hypothetical protein